MKGTFIITTKETIDFIFVDGVESANFIESDKYFRITNKKGELEYEYDDAEDVAFEPFIEGDSILLVDEYNQDYRSVEGVTTIRFLKENGLVTAFNENNLDEDGDPEVVFEDEYNDYVAYRGTYYGKD